MEEIIKDYEERIEDRINYLRNHARLLSEVTNGSIDWSHNLSWDVPRGDKAAARKELIDELKNQVEKLQVEIDKFESLIEVSS